LSRWQVAAGFLFKKTYRNPIVYFFLWQYYLLCFFIKAGVDKEKETVK